MAKTNVLIVGGRKLLREGLAAILRQHPDLSIVGDADSAQRAVKLLGSLNVDVVILNLSLAGQLGADQVTLLHAARHRIKTIVLSLNPSPQAMRLLLDAGASGYLTKECGSDELVEAIRSAVAGRRHLNSALVNNVVMHYAGRSSQASASKPLAPREREILQRIAGGQSTKGIANELGTSVKTVETHRRRMMEKLNRHSVAELTQYAVMEELIALENPI